MNKQLKFIIAGAAIVAGLASAVSCQDLSKDVESLTSRVSALEKSVADLQAQIKAGAVITDVASDADGVTVTLSDGKTFKITNGKNGDGTPGTVITIGENGNWFIDGQDTGLKAAGEDGQNGQNGKDGQNGEYYVPNPETGFFDKYTWNAETKKYEKTATDIPCMGSSEGGSSYGYVTVIWTEDCLIISGILDGDGQPLDPYVIPLTYASGPAAVSLIESHAMDGYAWLAGDWAQGEKILWNYSGLVCNFSNVIEKDNVFGEGLEGEMTFVEGQQTPYGAAFLIRVSPANYEPQPEEIQFVNSVGETFDAIEVESVEPYFDRLTKGETETGLWVVKVKLSEYDEEEFDYYTEYEDCPIVYAVKVGDAISTYDLSFSYQAFAPLYELGLYVGEENIAELNNRPYKQPTNSTNPKQDERLVGLYKEMQWSGAAAVAAITEGNDKNVEISGEENDEGQDVYPLVDNRAGKELYKAVIGEEIPITAIAENNEIVGIYVTLDFEENAIESKPSEWNAWKSYEDDIEGLNIVFEGNKAVITINDPKADGDLIGFRVFAVNADGTLVDPDGRAFYVQVGKPATELDQIDLVMETIQQFKDGRSNVAKTTIKSIMADDYSFKMLNGSGTLADGGDFNGEFHLIDENNNDLTVRTRASGLYDLSKIKSAYFVPKYDKYDSDLNSTDDGIVDLWAYVDDFTYKGEFTFYRDGFIVATLPVTFTKTLPVTIAEVPVKTSQLKDGIYRCFLLPSIWEAFDSVEDAEDEGQTGTIDMLSIFNFPNDDPNGFEITFANATKVEKNGKLVAANVTVTPTADLASDPDLDAEDNQLEIEYLDLIDNKTEHKTTVAYNMGLVSSELIAFDEYGDIEDIEPYVLPAGNFKTIFYCIYNEDATFGWPWNWGKDWQNATTNPVATVKKNSKLSIVYEDFNNGKLPASLITGQSKWDSKYKGNIATGYVPEGEDATIAIQGAQLLTDTGVNAGKEEYYTVEYNEAEKVFIFTTKSGAANPNDKVASTLVITYTDMYGHEQKATLPAEVLKR